eukprot:m.10128 g.10128  ORF g.10128 m.10128 type:complete len:265 (-) comp5543_c0_seq1:52-846(-)
MKRATEDDSAGDAKRAAAEDVSVDDFDYEDDQEREEEAIASPQPTRPTQRTVSLDVTPKEKKPVVPKPVSDRRRLGFAVVCSSNQNRSMEAHARLSKSGYQVRSFGTGQNVKLPGPSIDKPNVYEFGKTTYAEMYSDLLSKDPALYRSNGLLGMLERNIGIKERPEKFQTSSETFDVIVSCEGRVFDQIVLDFSSRPAKSNTAVHVLNVEIKDNPEEAIVGAGLILDLAEMLESCEDLENDIEDVLREFEGRRRVSVLHMLAFY